MFLGGDMKKVRASRSGDLSLECAGFFASSRRGGKLKVVSAGKILNALQLISAAGAKTRSAIRSIRATSKLAVAAVICRKAL